MSNALTPPNRKFKGDVDSNLRQLFDDRPSKHFPSYFGNFGNFDQLLMLRMQARVTKRRFRQDYWFPFITAFMAIV
jgi:hypothetical protein